MHETLAGPVFTYFDKRAYYNDVCMKSQGCALFEKENDINLARDFNYYGSCRSKGR